MNGALSKAANWAGVLIATLVPLLALAVAFGVLRSDVAHNAALIETKADREVAATRYEVLNARLDRIELKLDRLLSETGR